MLTLEDDLLKYVSGVGEGVENVLLREQALFQVLCEMSCDVQTR